MRSAVVDPRPARPDVAREAPAIAVVDRVLGSAGTRNVITNDEAVSWFHDVRSHIQDPSVRTSANSIINDAMSAFDHDRLLGRWRVVDPMLDIRLILERA